MWSVNQLARYLKVHRTTVQQRTNLFSDVLSEHAAPAPGEVRQFTPRDVAVMKRIAEWFDAKLTAPEIQPMIQAAVDAGDFDDVSTFPPIDFGESVPVEEHNQEIVQIASRYDLALRDRDNARQELAAAVEERGRLAGELARADAALDAAQQQLDTLTRQVAELQREVGRLEGGGAVVDELRRQIDDLKAERERLRAELDEERGRRRGLFGR